MPKYQLSQTVIADDQPDFEQLLQKGHEAKLRPLCLCQQPHPEMYIARLQDTFIVKRMPGTGMSHDSRCEHFEAPSDLTGLGDVMGRAIQLQNDGNTNLKLDFSLTKLGRRSAVSPSDAKSDVVKSDAGKLTLLGLLHYLWHEAELNKWSPRFAGRRTWPMVYGRLCDAAASKLTKTIPLLERLYIPEPYYQERAREIEDRRKTQLAPFKPEAGNKTDLFIIVGELKTIVASRFGFKILIKHASSFPIFMDVKTEAALRKRFDLELDMAEADENLRVVLMATASLNEAGSAQLVEATLMLTTKNWIPVERTEEIELIDQLTSDHRSFTMGLRFNVKSRPVASVILTDVKPACAMYIQPAEADDAYFDILAALETDHGLATWQWDSDAGSLPDIPPKTQA